ncbi:MULTISPECIES: winged helix-turn-helix domain-containing protein [Amycolatopsis]|uniref:GntR family transcriptional regulator n=1 Tax=Amycolatopsis TaxID=1813 RepID=UPI001E58E283|nr:MULTISPECIES: winged helix-turn-helix domain-containing protein [Amycolatopsis]
MPRVPNDLVGYVYEWLADDIAARIASGELPPRSALPNERRLAEEYRVSLGTARHAVEILRERGLVTTIRSKGTFVVERETNR